MSDQKTTTVTEWRVLSSTTDDDFGTDEHGAREWLARWSKSPEGDVVLMRREVTTTATEWEVSPVSDVSADLIEKVAKVLDPHWRSDCSDGEGRRYWRWVRCRCGWESEKSETLVNMPDMHAIWNEHIARAALEAVDLPGLLNTAKAEAWDEGWCMGVKAGWASTGTESPSSTGTNPYRPEEGNDRG